MDASGCKTFQPILLVECLKEAGLLPRLRALRFACQHWGRPGAPRTGLCWCKAMCARKAAGAAPCLPELRWPHCVLTILYAPTPDLVKCLKYIKLGAWTP